ncbi:MAG: heptaprenyl diphosphate synthase component 1 [Bacilli bacterium]
MREIEEIMLALTKYMDHPIARNYVWLPQISRGKVEMLCEQLGKSVWPKPLHKQIICALILMELALEMHDDLKRFQRENVSEEVAEPLVILLSDLFSGYYYKLLAHPELSSLLEATSEAVRKMNEEKMALRQTDGTAMEQLFALLAVRFRLFAPIVVGEEERLKQLLLEEMVTTEIHRVEAGAPPLWITAAENTDSLRTLLA